MIDHFLDQIASEYGDTRKKMEGKALSELEKMPWTGNIRELRNVIERLVIMSDNPIKVSDVKKYVDA